MKSTVKPNAIKLFGAVIYTQGKKLERLALANISDRV